MSMPFQGWSRKVDWCAVVAVPVVTLTAFLDPIDTFAGALHFGIARMSRAEPRIWLAGDVCPRVTGTMRPPDRRPRRITRAPRPRGRVRP